MPKAMEAALRRQADKHKWSKEHKDAFVYGTMRRMGWKPKRERNGHMDKTV